MCSAVVRSSLPPSRSHSPPPASLASQVQGNDPINDIKLLFNTIGSVIKGNAIAKPDRTFSNPVESLKRL